MSRRLSDVGSSIDQLSYLYLYANDKKGFIHGDTHFLFVNDELTLELAKRLFAIKSNESYYKLSSYDNIDKVDLEKFAKFLAKLVIVEDANEPKRIVVDYETSSITIPLYNITSSLYSCLAMLIQYSEGATGFYYDCFDYKFVGGLLTPMEVKKFLLKGDTVIIYGMPVYMNIQGKIRFLSNCIFVERVEKEPPIWEGDNAGE